MNADFQGTQVKEKDIVRDEITPPQQDSDVRNIPAPTDPQVQMLIALQGKPLYPGTVPEHVIAHRRARGKMAKRSRKINRGIK